MPSRNLFCPKPDSFRGRIGGRIITSIHIHVSYIRGLLILPENSGSDPPMYIVCTIIEMCGVWLSPGSCSLGRRPYPSVGNNLVVCMIWMRRRHRC
jgi:hypothetical protein